MSLPSKLSRSIELMSIHKQRDPARSRCSGSPNWLEKGDTHDDHLRDRYHYTPIVLH